MADEQVFIPKGGMCVSCLHKREIEFCKKLNFEGMPKISKSHDDGHTIVKCIEFEREARLNG